MTIPYITQTLDHCFGDVGALHARYDFWRAKIKATAPGLRTTPAREAAPLFALAERTDDLAEIEAIAREITEQYAALVVVGMGGSSLSAETLAPLRKSASPALHIIDNIDPRSIATLVETLDWPRTAFLVISKSGNTVETHAQMAVLLREAKTRIGSSYGKHFTVVTILNQNPLHRLAEASGMRLVAHDPDLGGRFSVLSAVGLIPAAVLGVDIRGLRAGAQQVMADNFSGNHGAAVDAAAIHMALMEKQLRTQVLMHYADGLAGAAAWYRQCWAESLGKDGKGATLIPSRGATDQHSQLQLYLEGPRDKYFTAVMLDMHGQGASIAMDGADASFAYLSNHTLGDLVMAEQRATNATLVKASCPLRVIHCRAFDEPTVGTLLMHFALEVVFTASLMEVNAFNQPAVEAGKRLALDYLAKSK